MSTLAAWLFAILSILLLALIVYVIVAGVRTLRKGNSLRRELHGFQTDVGRVVGSAHPQERRDNLDG